MKFLLVSPFSSISGSAVRFRNMAVQLEKHGHEVVYVERKTPGVPSPELDNITYLTSPVLQFLFFDMAVSTLFNFYVLFKHCNCSVFYALKPAPNNCFPALFAKLIGKRVFIDIDDLDYGYFKPGFKRNISKFFFEFFPKHFELITCHTDKLYRYIVDSLQIPVKKVYYLAQGVSQEFLDFKPVTAEKRKPFSIIYVATLGITSDLEDILPMLSDFFSAFPQAFISIVGSGPHKNYLEELSRRLKIEKNCFFLGNISHEKMPELMNRHLVGINYMRSSLTNECRASLKTREYLACGLQVICNDMGDAEMFRDYVYVEKDIENMKVRLESIMLNKCSKTGGRKALQTNYSWPVIIDDFLKKTGI
jgi:glycosyltransferase involved in cell wall biosynthesis